MKFCGTDKRQCGSSSRNSGTRIHSIHSIFSSIQTKLSSMYTRIFWFNNSCISCSAWRQELPQCFLSVPQYFMLSMSAGAPALPLICSSTFHAEHVGRSSGTASYLFLNISCWAWRQELPHCLLSVLQYFMLSMPAGALALPLICSSTFHADHAGRSSRTASYLFLNISCWACRLELSHCLLSVPHHFMISQHAMWCDVLISLNDFSILGCAKFVTTLRE